MTPEGWATNIGAIIAASIAGWQSFEAKRAAQQGERAAQAGAKSASVAAARSLPTANGFVPDLIDRLDRLQEGQDEQGRRLDRHIDDHASSDLRRPRPRPRN